MEMFKIKLGISSCLLGQTVRYDGNHKLDRYLKDVLGKYVQWIPVCPEYECGLGVPREAMRLVNNGEQVRLLTIKTKQDRTDQLLSFTHEVIKKLSSEDLCGFVFKSKSPSSGLKDAKVYDTTGNVIGKGPGLFAEKFIQVFPYLPVEDEGRLHNEDIRENFLERVFVYARWRQWFSTEISVEKLVHWQRDHKLLIMAHSPLAARTLGKMVADYHHGENKDILASRYFKTMMESLELRATIKKNVNVLYHAAGYFKKKLSSDEKKELSEIIENYHNELVPLIVPVTLLNHYVRKFNESYLKNQHYLNPHPLELKLRNHV